MTTFGKRPRISRFLWILIGTSVVAHICPAVGISEGVRRLGWGAPWAWGLALFLGGSALFLGRARIGVTDHHRHAAMLRLVDIPYFVHWCAAIFALVPSAVALLVSPVVDLVRGDALGLPRAAFLWIYVTGLVLSAYGVLLRRRIFHVIRLDVPIQGLDPAFDGYRIAHLSDLHIGALTPKAWGLRWTRAANALGADLAVVTGDMVTNGTEFHADIAEVVGSLRAKDGVVVSMGNHDYFGNGEPMISMIRAKGPRVLRNEGMLLEREGKHLYLAAVDDTWTQRADLGLALAARPEGARTVLLAHDPEEFDAAARRDVDLVLSGHTHGGQIALPFFARYVNLSRLSHKYHLGLYERGSSTLYVHPGLGTTGPPIRLGVAPAIALITLRAVPAQGEPDVRG